jgi:DNA repair protein RadC
VCSDKLQARFGGGPGEKAEKSDLARGLPYGINTVSVGSLTASVVHPREVFKAAILSNAAALLGCHNHPSGAPQPSREDRALTTRLVDAGKLMGIALLDHIILGDGNETYYSFADEGVL